MMEIDAVEKMLESLGETGVANVGDVWYLFRPLKARENPRNGVLYIYMSADDYPHFSPHLLRYNARKHDGYAFPCWHGLAAPGDMILLGVVEGRFDKLSEMA